MHVFVMQGDAFTFGSTESDPHNVARRKSAMTRGTGSLRKTRATVLINRQPLVDAHHESLQA